MKISRIAVLLLLLAVVAGGAFFALGGEGGDELPPQGVVETPRTGSSDSASIQVDNGIGPSGGRRGVRNIIGDQPATNTGYDQGIMGAVYGPSGNPVHGASVFLVESSTNNMFERFLAVQEGVVFLPTASGQTDVQGRFALGLRESVPGVVFEVKIISAMFADHKIPNLSIQENDWYEAPAVVLSAGTMVHGQVSLAGQGLPVPGAVVYIKAAGGFSDIVPIPGRERGLRVEVDANGYFQTRNAPAGIVDISAVAPYFARMEERGVNLEAMVANEVNFELSRGLTIRGIVTDPTGVPVGGAKVLAASLLPKQPQIEETRTARDGRFEFLSMVEAPFQLTAMAQGFQRQDEQPVQAGADDVQLVLERQASARVRVLGRGRQLNSYLLSVKRHYPAQDQLGNAQNQTPRNIRGTDLRNGYATVGNLDTGDYVFQIDALGYARTFSHPFRVGPGIQAPELEVPMSEGGTISGTVVDASGSPASGVAVETQTNGFSANGFGEIFGPILPQKITAMSVHTDAQGRYRLEVMAKGMYQLKFTHPDLCEMMAKDLVLAEGQTTEVPVVIMLQGARVIGTTMVDGVAAGQVKVLIQRRPPASGAISAGAFSASAVSDSQGQYVIPKRLPPGTYQIQATTQSDAVFGAFLDYEKTRQTFTVPQGQGELRMNVNVPTG